MSKHFSGPRMSMSQLNGSNRRPSNLGRLPSIEKPSCPQHDDLIKYICESWNKVAQDVDRSTGNAAIYYHEEHQNLKDFEPFDLERYWGRRLVQTTIQQTQHS